MAQHAALGTGTVKYTQITTATYTVTLGELSTGVNIFGVLFDGSVTITIPNDIPSTSLVTFVNEGVTGTITVQVG